MKLFIWRIFLSESELELHISAKIIINWHLLVYHLNIADPPHIQFSRTVSGNSQLLTGAYNFPDFFHIFYLSERDSLFLFLSFCHFPFCSWHQHSLCLFKIRYLHKQFLSIGPITVNVCTCVRGQECCSCVSFKVNIVPLNAKWQKKCKHMRLSKNCTI